MEAEELDNLLEIKSQTENIKIINRFPVLDKLASIARGIGILFIIIGILGGISIVVGMKFVNFLTGIYLLITCLLVSLFWFITSEIIFLFLQIEKNTRKTQN